MNLIHSQSRGQRVGWFDWRWAPSQSGMSLTSYSIRMISFLRLETFDR